MEIIHKTFKVKNDVTKPKFHDITKKIKEFISDSGVKKNMA